MSTHGWQYTSLLGIKLGKYMPRGDVAAIIDKDLNSRQEARIVNSDAPLAEEADVNDDFPCQDEDDDDAVPEFVEGDDE